MAPTVVLLHRKNMAEEKRAPAILSALRFELEQRDVGFTETHGPDERARRAGVYRGRV